MFRLRIATTSALAATVARRFVKATDPTYEDDRWLEAEFQDVEKTVEERYAHEKQKELMKRLLAKMREENNQKLEAKHEEIKATHDEHKEHVSTLKEELNLLKEKLAKLTGEK